MSDDKNVDTSSRREQPEKSEVDVAAAPSEVSSIAGSTKGSKTNQRISSERQIKFERAQKCLENAALVSKRIKEHRKATAQLLGKPFEDDTASETASGVSVRTGRSVATDTSAALSVQEALNIPGISESLANTLKQKELLMQRIQQYKEVTKKTAKSPVVKRDSATDVRKVGDTDVAALQSAVKEKDSALSVAQVKLRALEATVHELQEQLTEKDQILQAKNKATTIMSDNLSKKEKDMLVLLEDTRQQMTKMQENFIAMEAEWKEEKLRLQKEIQEKDKKIMNLEEANTILENSRFEIDVAHSKLVEELKAKNKEITYLQTKLEEIMHLPSPKEKFDVKEEKGSLEIANMAELTKKIELLEQLNCQIRQTNKELENKLAASSEQKSSTPTGSPTKKASPLPIRKGGRNTATKAKSPWSKLSSESLPQETGKQSKADVSKLEMVIQSLNKEILDKEYIISQKDDMIAELQTINAQIEASVLELKAKTEAEKLKVDASVSTEKQALKTISTDDAEVKSKTEEPLDVTELAEKLKAAQDQIEELNHEIDAANKNMIKVKSNYKLKLKQMQKTIDNFSKASDANAEVVRLNEELQQLSQKVAELEEEKGNLQLHLVDYDSGRLTETDVYKKLMEMETLAETRLKAISTLEAQKFDLVQELHILQQKNVEMEDKLADMAQMQSEQVSTEIKSVQLEEQVDQLVASKKEFEIVLENLKHDKEQLDNAVKALEEEKVELTNKLEHYIQENIELTDKLEKLSAEKVSSAESIEIVESLTTQEKLELEQYSKNIKENNGESQDFHDDTPKPENINEIVKETEELHRKIELFTQERQEVMEKMNNISLENETLQARIVELSHQSLSLQHNIDLLNKEKTELVSLNEQLNRQIEEMKQERLDIMKDSLEMAKPSSLDEVEGGVIDTHTDDKSASDKSTSKTKTVKQLTKEVLKLKNTIKEREDEIADCQMKILALEEQQQKQSDMVQNIASYESKINSLLTENTRLRDEVNNSKNMAEIELQFSELKETNELLHQELQRAQSELSVSVANRETRIQELEHHLKEYEKQMYTYGNTLQQKDKEIIEYINQITKLNDVCQKLKSTIEMLEEEKAKDQNAELIKTLNKQITAYQMKIADCDEKLRNYEEEKLQLLSLKNNLENKNNALEIEMKNLQDILAEKQILLKDLQIQQQKHDEEVSSLKLQAKDRDEEIHEIKLQLRKESIENEKLRTALAEKDNGGDEVQEKIKELNEHIKKLNLEKNVLSEQINPLETKNKELLEKLKKFAATIKKKSAICIDLENQLHETQTQLEAKNLQLEQLQIQNETLPSLQDKLKFADEEMNRMQSSKHTLEHENMRLVSEISDLKDSLNVLQKELYVVKEEKANYIAQIDLLNKKLAEHDIESKNAINFVTKIASLESEMSQKQAQVTDLSNKLEYQEQHLNQLQYSYDAKIQEKDMFIESLEGEINKYKGRICRLEDSISAMEDRRHSLERKADQLDTQLREKQKAYTEYTSQEDELVSRIAVLMDHDRVVEKQLFEIENENKELQLKLQSLSEENERLKKAVYEIQEYCNTLTEKASRTDMLDSEINKYQIKLQEVEGNYKRITHDHQLLLAQKKQVIEEIESEFNIQIENSIKEKKFLSEKYEKVIEHVKHLESKLQEYQNNIRNLTVNVEELTRFNQELSENKRDKSDAPDYTEQYISEINKLNSLLINKTQEASELNNALSNQKNQSALTILNLETKVSEISSSLKNICLENEKLVTEMESYKQQIFELQNLLTQKDEQIQHLKNEKSVMFEVNIPKTEGMLISSKIEQVTTDQDQTYKDIESQIISDLPPQKLQHDISISEAQPAAYKSGEVVEPIITPKKTYLCYDDEEDNAVASNDPFNSDEGWGFGDSEEATNFVIPGMAHINSQLEKLRAENQSLQDNLETVNNKLLKALKKLKDLKTENEVLSHEIKLSKQLSQSSFLDSAIEDEFKINIQRLEKRIDELQAELNKEKKEKDALKKQNEVIVSANEKLTDMKEKMDNELELWKFKFKEANDKMSSLQREGGSKDSPQHALPTGRVLSDSNMKDEIAKLESENDELQNVIDQFMSKNKDLESNKRKLEQELKSLKTQINLKSSCNECGNLTRKLKELQDAYDELVTSSNNTYSKLKDTEKRFNEITTINSQLLSEKESLHEQQQQLSVVVQENNLLKSEVEALKQKECIGKERISSLESEVEYLKTNSMVKMPQGTSLCADSFAAAEKYTTLEDHCQQLKHTINEYEMKLTLLERSEYDLKQKLQVSESEVVKLKEKLDNLNAENDQLLSTVAELRSSVASAVDQRGFEIAELWKQHLAQRETDFQNLEQELRSQLSTSETKYEQLLDSVQSSSQEQTNQLVEAEQLATLQSKLHGKEEYLQDLRKKYGEVVNQLDILRSEMEDEKLLHENKLLSQQEEYEKQIVELTQRNQQSVENYGQSVHDVQRELDATKAANNELSEEVYELKNKLQQSEATITELTTELEVKESEIHQKYHDYTLTLSQRNEEFEALRKQLVEYERKIEDLTFEKESELAVLRLKMHEDKTFNEQLIKDYELDKANLIEELNEKVIEITKRNKEVSDLNKQLEEYSAKFSEMQTALESQEYEIVTLKDELSSMQELFRNSKIEKHVTFAADTKPGTEEEAQALNRDLLDGVPRAEYDLAMYMLHQRDVRCDELTVELTQLLEERDTLQLRLSDCLRAHEALKVACRSAGLEVPGEVPSGPETTTYSVERDEGMPAVHRKTSSSDADNALQDKLTELRSVRQMRDVRLRHDSEQRQLDLQRIQRDVASLPSPARDRLAQAHHTLSRDAQNTPTVLLNWLRGRSTPRVLDM